MIHYHGTPIGGARQDTARFLMGRHALVPFIRPDDIGVVGDVCASFVMDNSAFSAWTRNIEFDGNKYRQWVREWCRHPAFVWALIPDVIDGTEKQNDDYISRWCDSGLDAHGVPVWHLHETLERLQKLADEWPVVAIGSSGQWRTPGTRSWWGRMAEALDAVCDKDGRPIVKLHGLRMLDPDIFTKIPFASADSTNAAVNSGSVKRFGMYKPATTAQRAAVIADRIEAQQSAAIWMGGFVQEKLC